jgi:hypothetical protein
MQLFSISGAEFGGGMQPVIDRFLDDESYRELGERSLESVRAGKGPAFLVPAVKFLLDATHGILAQPSVQERLPREIASRMDIARNLAHNVVKAAVDRDVLTDFYLKRKPFASLKITGGALVILVHPKPLTSLTQSPFNDACMAAGGGFKLLEQDGESANATKILTRSTGLLALSGIDKSNTETVTATLGFPYMDVGYLERRQRDGDTEVLFTPQTHAFLRAHSSSGSGCPAGLIEAPDTVGGTVLEAGWADLVEYLVPPGATAAMPNTPPVYM